MSAVIVGKVDVFDPRFDARVIPVNCDGVMGKGLAKEATRRYPAIVGDYRDACLNSRLAPGGIVSFPSGPGVILAATKRHWRSPSRGSWVLACCEELARASHDGPPMKHVAVPALGCGLGWLPWEWHMPAIRYALSQGWGGATFYLCPPGDP